MNDSLRAIKIRLLIVEDHEIIRLGLKTAIDGAEFEVVGELDDGENVVETVNECQPNVVIMDMGMQRVGGIAATAQIKQRCPDVRVLMLTSRDSNADLINALKAGADGYCLKDISTGELKQALKRIHEGHLWVDRRLAARVPKDLPELLRRSAPGDHGDQP